MITLHQSEEKILEVRRHLFVFYARMLWPLILLLLPLVAFSVFRGFMESVFGGSSAVIFLFFYLFWILILWMSFFYQWTDYYFDVWIITNERVIDLEQKGFFNRQMSTLRIERIQDITVSIEGIVATFLKFGDIHVHSASHDGHDSHSEAFIIKQARNPFLVKEKLLELSRTASDRGQRDNL
jgi:uncharacterized membrane protein YdbT with pleckstrin-like domain